jgi:poly(A) polymerase/tRNA nucleotidyltransferase (CCA-adding enzyme)
VTLASLLAAPGLAPILAALPRARLVGGCVRDQLAGAPVADIDIATPDAPEAVLAALAACGVRAIPTGLSHGTVTALNAARVFEITTLRRDVSTDGRHAVVAWTDDFVEDAARRDFTINAMSLDQSGVLHDYFGGEADLAAGRVRFVGDAALRVAEDYLRILRYFRFYARYGGETPDIDAVAAIRAGRAGLAGISAERIWRELKYILAAPRPVRAIVLMEELGVLASIVPDGFDVAALVRMVAIGAPADPLLRFAALFTGDIDQLSARLKLASAERDRLFALRHGPVPAPQDNDAALLRLLADEPAILLLDRLWLTGRESRDLQERIRVLPKPVFPLEGRDALALGISPGPHIGEALRAVRSWWKEGGCVAEKEVLLQMLAEKLKSEHPS